MSRFVFVGRMVQGDVHKAQPQRKDQRTGALKFRKDGSPDCPFYVALAIPKDPAKRLVIPGVPDYDSQRALIDQDARTSWPQFFTGQRPPNVQFDLALPADCNNPKFANKIIDGDGYDDQGKPYSRYDGWAGCWVIKFQNGYAPSVQAWVVNHVDPMRPGAAPYTGWLDFDKMGRAVKCGDYISVGGSCESNKSTESPGMYMNFDTIGFEQEGELIVQSGGVDANEALGSRGGAAPAGNAAPAATPAAPAAGAPTSPTAAPYDGYRAPTTAGAAPTPPVTATTPPPPPAGPQMTAAAQYTYDQYKASGWTDDQLRAGGLMV